jgi:hypothetical protein
MSVTEEIVKEAVGLDFTQQRELLMGGLINYNTFFINVFGMLLAM